MPRIGVTVLPEYFQSETVDGVLDRLQAVGVNAVTTSPYVMEPCDEGSGAREPPIDAGAGSVRLLDRPLWGKRELWVRTSPSFTPNLQRYQGLRYQPPQPDALGEREGAVIQQVIEGAHQRGMHISLQVQAAIPPGYRVQFGGPAETDKPLLPDGRVPPQRVANNGSLASPDIVAYHEALLGDLCEQYPEVDMIRVDWPEYPPYSLDDMFVDFSEHARQAANDMGFDFERMQRDAGKLYQLLHGGLDNRRLAQLAESGPYGVADLLLELPGVTELTRFKCALSGRLLSGFRRVLNDTSGGRIQLMANLFPWPWSLASGAGTYRLVAQHCDALAIKLYGMHWKMMFRFYCDRLLAENPSVNPQLVVQVLLDLLGIMDIPGSLEPDAYRYPGPEEPHGVGRQAQLRKIALAASATGDTPVYTLMHGYGPPEDFADRLEIARSASDAGFWINRYGYLSDEKLGLLG